jgi:hypothetical protein
VRDEQIDLAPYLLRSAFSEINDDAKVRAAVWVCSVYPSAARARATFAARGRAGLARTCQSSYRARKLNHPFVLFAAAAARRARWQGFFTVYRAVFEEIEALELQAEKSAGVETAMKRVSFSICHCFSAVCLTSERAVVCVGARREFGIACRVGSLVNGLLSAVAAYVRQVDDAVGQRGPLLRLLGQLRQVCVFFCVLRDIDLLAGASSCCVCASHCRNLNLLFAASFHFCCLRIDRFFAANACRHRSVVWVLI